MKEHSIHPTVFIGVGSMGNESGVMVARHIKKTFGGIPGIFGFIYLKLLPENDKVEIAANIGNTQVLKSVVRANSIKENSSEIQRLLNQVYDGVINVRNIYLSDKQSFQIDQSLFETYIVSSLCEPMVDSILIELAQRIGEKVSKGMLFSHRKGIFILSEMFFPGDIALLEENTLRMLEKLDESMESDKPPFENCFFIDRSNEKGHTIDRADSVSLVSEFLFNCTITLVANEIRKKIKPYVGISPVNQAYCSFGLVSSRYDYKKVISFNIYYLEQKLCHSLTNALGQELVDIDRLVQSENKEPYKWILDLLYNNNTNKLEKEFTNEEKDEILSNLYKEIASKVESLFLETGGNIPSIVNLLTRVRCEASQVLSSLLDKIRLLKREIVRMEVKRMFYKPPTGTPITKTIPRNQSFIVISALLMVVAIMSLLLNPLLGIVLLIPTIGFFFAWLQKKTEIVEYNNPLDPFRNLPAMKKELDRFENLKGISQDFGEYIDRLLIKSDEFQSVIVQHLEGKSFQNRDYESLSDSPFIRNILEKDDMERLFPRDQDSMDRIVGTFFREFGLDKYIFSSPEEYLSDFRSFCSNEFKWVKDHALETMLKKKFALNPDLDYVLQLESYLKHVIDESAVLCQIDRYGKGSSSIIVGVNASVNSSIDAYFRKIHHDIALVSIVDNQSIVILQLRQGLPIDSFISARQPKVKKNSDKKKKRKM